MNILYFVITLLHLITFYIKKIYNFIPYSNYKKQNNIKYYKLKKIPLTHNL